MELPFQTLMKCTVSKWHYFIGFSLLIYGDTYTHARQMKIRYSNILSVLLPLHTHYFIENRLEYISSNDFLGYVFDLVTDSIFGELTPSIHPRHLTFFARHLTRSEAYQLHVEGPRIVPWSVCISSYNYVILFYLFDKSTCSLSKSYS